MIRAASPYEIRCSDEWQSQLLTPRSPAKRKLKPLWTVYDMTEALWPILSPHMIAPARVKQGFAVNSRQDHCYFKLYQERSDGLVLE